MTTKSRTYPDISYVETDTETIVNALIQGYEKIAGRTLYPADPARLFILWVADIIVQERVNIDFSAKQNIPRYAEGEYLDSLAELFKGAERLEPEKARTTLQYTLSIPLEVATTIPAGTRATPDGEIVFATLEDLTIPAGQRTGGRKRKRICPRTNQPTDRRFPLLRKRREHHGERRRRRQGKRRGVL